MEAELLSLSPSEVINFDFQPDVASRAVLKLSSANSSSVAFKVKNTSPKDFIVRPFLGMLLPGSEQSISITMQPRSKLPETQFKFLVEYAPTSGPVQDLGAFFNALPPNMRQSCKLLVSFSPAVDTDLRSHDEIEAEAVRFEEAALLQVRHRQKKLTAQRDELAAKLSSLRVSLASQRGLDDEMKSKC
jgi:P pilus assembly chaperone PapD